MYKKRKLKNGNTKLESSSRIKYAIFSRKENRVTFNAGVNQYIVDKFEREMMR